MASTENQPKKSSVYCDADDALLMAMELPSSAVLPMVFKAAIELDLLEIIAKAGPDAQLSPSVIASQLHTQNPEAPEMVDRILRLLASYSMITCSPATHHDGSVERLYGLAPVSTYFLSNRDAPFAGLLKMLNHKAFLQSWHHLKDAVLEGGTPFDKANGISVYDYAAKDPSFNESFNTGLMKGTIKAIKEILDKYNGFENAKVIVDVGGGIGNTLESVTSKYPNIKGINFDLPHVLQNAPAYPGVEHLAGDMFVHVPAGDIILLKAVLHNWGDDDCLKLLKNCYEALPDHGKVVVIERVLPVIPETTTDAKALFRLDLFMLAQHPGGKERTEKQFEILAKAAGFTVVKIRPQQQKGLSSELLKYKGPIHCAQIIIREEGLLGLWSGAAPTVMRNGINQSAMFTAKNAFDVVFWRKHEGDGKVLQPWQSMVSGFMAGTVGPICTGPFDAVKTRLMAQSRLGDGVKYRGMFHAIRTIGAEEGVLALWKGLLPRLMRIPPWSGHHVGTGRPSDGLL